MATADVLRKIVNKLEDSALEIESKSREMFKGAQLDPGKRDIYSRYYLNQRS